jgi:hypothetical protein
MENDPETEMDPRQEENAMAIMVSSQPWKCDPPVTESGGRRILWPPPPRDESGWGAW